jgi:hypothetical protein
VAFLYDFFAEIYAILSVFLTFCPPKENPLKQEQLSFASPLKKLAY